jgi:hypothetical protein
MTPTAAGVAEAYADSRYYRDRRRRPRSAPAVEAAGMRAVVAPTIARSGREARAGRWRSARFNDAMRVALIPMKDLAGAKMRLADVLDRAERAELAVACSPT